MARADTITLIPLDRAAAHLGIDPWHFNSIEVSTHPFRSSCSDDWYQYSWQSSGKLSREDLAFALRDAERKVVEHLNWTPIATYQESEVPFPDYYKTEAFSYYNSRGYQKTLATPMKHLIEMGRKATALIDTPETTFSDIDGDGIDDTVTITFATTVTEEQELHVYYPDKNGRDEWEIRPLTSISISGGVATITFPKWLIPLEDLINAPPDPDDPHIIINGDVNTNFLEEVDVYRVYTDVSQQITFYAEPESVCGAAICTDSTYTGCGTIKNARLGHVRANRADWDEDDETYTSKSFTFIPRKAIIYYRAGYVDNSLEYPYLQMDRGLERMIVYFALSLLDLELCGCDNTRNIWHFMTQDLAANTEDISFNMPWDIYNNPLGTSRAAITLWKHIKDMKVSDLPSRM